MIERHRELFRTLPDEAIDHVAAYFGVGEAVCVREALEALSPPVDLADVAWALCQAPDPVRRAGLDALGVRYSRREVERPWPRPLPAVAAREPGAARVVRVHHSHSWLPATAPVLLPPGYEGPPEQETRLVRVQRGVAVAALLAKGVSRRDIDRAARAGNLEVG